ncbi:MAG: hypothetical protein BGP01_04265 [Paludibacter sp. 47-17]|nr:MAG: hypothetical protein BGP01_04265 [Paludibacter sp. 47-17]
MMRLFWISLFGSLYVISAVAAPFRADSLYSKWIIDSRMGDFRNKTETVSFLTPAASRTAGWDYVPGLVAKAIVKAWEQYSDKPWSEVYFAGIQDYADHVKMHLGESNIDDLNAAKIFFELYRGATAKGQTEKAARYKKDVTYTRDLLKYQHRRIEAPLPGAGGFWHKLQYVNQMWLDGLYMGPALYAEWQGNFGAPGDVESWDDIAKQFDTIFHYTWDPAKKLNYHAWAAEPLNKASSFWADPATGRSMEFWGRGVGWFFAALVDVLEYMPEHHPARPRLMMYTEKVADGLKARRDKKSGCWYQLLQYDNRYTGRPCNIPNYLESSASAMFIYSYLKGMRLGVLKASKYKKMAVNSYLGFIDTFVVEEPSGTIKLIGSCESAGLSGSRKGDADYYLCGSDVAIHNDTEGKVLGPFIMASLEFERLRTGRP